MEHLRITINGKSYDVVVEKCDSPESGAGVHPAPAAHPPSQPVTVPAPAATPPAPAAKPAPAALSQGAENVTSPLTGIVNALPVAPGSAVKEGDLVITLEAMKMYTSINAPRDGTVTSIHVSIGDAVDEGQPLFSLE
jgi:biotin carboxyl carrier protein